jgi:hypothetical protein
LRAAGCLLRYCRLTAAIEPYLPIVRVLIVLGGTVPALRERLIERVEAALRSEA